MKQILQNISNGETLLAEVPAPGVRAGSCLIHTTRTLVSLGTEKMLVDFGKAGWIDKARQQPDKVKQVIQKVKTDGLMPTIDAVKAKLDQPLPLGYCNAGVVLESDGPFAAGDRVVSNGHHAETVCISHNLCAKIPDSVDDESAAFTVVGAIALQGIRLAQPTLGETFVVTGLGLIGLIAVQLLRAHGCRVIGIDFDAGKLALARDFGAETVQLGQGGDPVAAAEALTRGQGVDGVIITASTKSDEPVHQAAEMCRKRGRIVLVGVVGLQLSRADFYEKELSFQVSCSYGPGRYEANYEDRGMDYPIGFVRWTEQRNFEAVLQMMAEGKLDVMPLISHRFKIEEALSGYEVVATGKAMGILLEYPESTDRSVCPTVELGRAWDGHSCPSGACVIGLIGAGGFTGQVLLPALASTSAKLKTIVSSTGVSGTQLGNKFGFAQSSTDTNEVFNDAEINTVFITTRHNSHAALVIRALKAGKHVFVEKPLCLTHAELEEVTSLLDGPDQPILMVGFNRRFAPTTQSIKKVLEQTHAPKAMVMTVNAGAIPAEHWTQDPDVGGGRIRGEACHFVDLLRYLAGSPIVEHSITYADVTLRDTASIQLKFEDGSIGTIHYFANGHKGLAKERLEVFCEGKVASLDNFRSIEGHGWSIKSPGGRQDKGHSSEVAAFVRAVEQGGAWPIPLKELVEVTRVTLDMA
ncbi:MAG: putative dehydrogenase/threonine dehydrogenase-like Zn-dependent dehydrogenase [Candidatus Omnitrophota bacterium]|jgi:predicted dehydrogenase/threonine dehydrogenase-like Zn-dependent dehydrogenase